MTKRERYDSIIDYFKTNQPEAKTELLYETPFQLLVAVILSAQCTDKRVNLITPSFFIRFPDSLTLSRSSEDEVFEYISSCSYPNNKSKHLVNMAAMLVNDFNGEVPDSIAALQKLPGVGRKTANVIASVVFNQPAMAVDTHVFRVSERLGLTTRAKTPLEAERQLVKYIPREYLSVAHHWLILHGRYVCVARKPKCCDCPIRAYCKYFEKSNRE